MIKLSENGINDYNMCPVIISHGVRNIVLKLIFKGDNNDVINTVSSS